MDQSRNFDVSPGPIVLFGSGETSPSGRKVFERILRHLPMRPRLALLETPAGFELNSSQVIGRVGDFLSHRLQNYQPQIEIVPARRRGTPFSPDDPRIVAPLLNADLIFMGPGSPTYAVRQLRDSLAWQYLLARHRLGAALVLASAATIAISSSALPVYEIYKVGEDLHWKGGLDFFCAYGLDLVFVPHWNNTEGGEELDTRHCFMGEERFTRLMAMLPEEMTVVGLDEKTALIIDPESGGCQVVGAGGVTLLHTGHLHKRSAASTGLAGGLQELIEQRESHSHYFKDGQSFPLSDIGPFRAYHPEANLPADVWQKALAAVQPGESGPTSGPPEEVLSLVQEREQARLRKDWHAADVLRGQVEESGWVIKDTPDGPQVTPR
jgi:hypothetical protein